MITFYKVTAGAFFGENILDELAGSTKPYKLKREWAYLRVRLPINYQWHC